MSTVERQAGLGGRTPTRPVRGLAAGVLGAAAEYAARGSRGLRRAAVRPRRAFLLTPASRASLGDEAILTAAARVLSDRGVRITATGYKEAVEWGDLSGIDDHYFLRPYFHSSSHRPKLAFKWEMRRHDVFVVAGTDVMDGKYSEHRTLKRIGLMRMAAECGVPVEMIGISVCREPSEACMAAMRDLPDHVIFRTRDPQSHARLEAAIGRRVELVADLAFLLEPTANSPLLDRTRDWIAAQRRSGRLVVGVNISHHVVRGEEAHLEEGVRRVHEAVASVAKAQPVAVVLLPHDSRGEHNDGYLNTLFCQAIAGQADLPCLPIEFPVKAAEIKAITGELDVVLTGRMHVAIASLGMKTPVACLTYQDKFEGLFDHFGLSDVGIDGKELWVPGRAADMLTSVLTRRQALREQIAAKLDHVVTLAYQNLGWCKDS